MSGSSANFLPGLLRRYTVTYLTQMTGKVLPLLLGLLRFFYINDKLEEKGVYYYYSASDAEEDDTKHHPPVLVS